MTIDVGLIIAFTFASIGAWTLIKIVWKVSRHLYMAHKIKKMDELRQVLWKLGLCETMRFRTPEWFYDKPDHLK